jgi:hypothetical protein
LIPTVIRMRVGDARPGRIVVAINRLDHAIRVVEADGVCAGHEKIFEIVA